MQISTKSDRSVSCSCFWTHAGDAVPVVNTRLQINLIGDCDTQLVCLSALPHLGWCGVNALVYLILPIGNQLLHGALVHLSDRTWSSTDVQLVELEIWPALLDFPTHRSCTRSCGNWRGSFIFLVSPRMISHVRAIPVLDCFDAIFGCGHGLHLSVLRHPLQRWRVSCFESRRLHLGPCIPIRVNGNLWEINVGESLLNCHVACD